MCDVTTCCPMHASAEQAGDVSSSVSVCVSVYCCGLGIDGILIMIDQTVSGTCGVIIGPNTGIEIFQIVAITTIMAAVNTTVTSCRLVLVNNSILSPECESLQFVMSRQTTSRWINSTAGCLRDQLTDVDWLAVLPWLWHGPPLSPPRLPSSRVRAGAGCLFWALFCF